MQTGKKRFYLPPLGSAARLGNYRNSRSQAKELEIISRVIISLSPHCGDGGDDEY